MVAPPLHIKTAGDVAALGTQHHYRRAKLHGQFSDKTLYWFAQINFAPAGAPLSRQDRVGYHVLQLFELQDGTPFAVDRGFIPARLKGEREFAITNKTIEVIIRASEPRRAFSPSDNLDEGVLFVRDTKTLASAWRVDLPAIFGAAAKMSANFPIGGQSRLVLSNRHLGYMLTWLGLAGVLAIVSLVWHIRAFRQRRHNA